MELYYVFRYLEKQCHFLYSLKTVNIHIGVFGLKMVSFACQKLNRKTFI